MASNTGIDLKAVFLGFLADTGGTIAIAVVLAAALSAAGVREDEILERMQSTSGLLLSLIFGLGCSVLGGYVAGRIARRDEIRHGAIAAGLGLILGLLFREAGLPLWYELIGIAGIIPAGMAGGYLAAERTAESPK